MGTLSLFSWNETVPSLSDGKRWRAAVDTDEASLTGLLLTSCCAAWFLTDQGLKDQYWSAARGLWGPALNPIVETFYKANNLTSSNILNK